MATRLQYSQTHPLKPGRQIDPGYKSKPLDEVVPYQSTNHHRPDVPPAADKKQNGIGVAEMQSKLLAKIEELVRSKTSIGTTGWGAGLRLESSPVKH